ncbi:MAG TPA: DUF4397 domain-containing protein, partial [Streptosporangiaceae bacterium]
MRFRFVAPRAARLLLAPALGLCTLVSGLVAATAPAASAAPVAESSGWIRLAHLSPNTPAVDVYLYSFDNPHAMIVLKHVGYGAVSPYEKVASGSYTVAMRGAGAPASSQPVLSANVQITAGGAYTVAGMGPAAGLRLQVLRDRLTTPPGKSLVRIIQASLQEHVVTVSAGTHVLAQDVAFAHVTPYAIAPPGTWTTRAAGTGESASQQITLGAGTIHTLVVLDSASGLKLDDIEDAAGSAVLPQGGAGTGLGGT